MRDPAALTHPDHANGLAELSLDQANHLVAPTGFEPALPP